MNIDRNRNYLRNIKNKGIKIKKNKSIRAKIKNKYFINFNQIKNLKKTNLMY